MHKAVVKSVTKNRARNLLFHNKNTNIVQPNFFPGIFVLVRRGQDRVHKMSFRYTRQRKILVAPIDEGSSVSKELKANVERPEATCELMKTIVIIGEDVDEIHLQVRWLEFPDKRDWTWLPLTTIHEDTPDMLMSFLKTYSGKKTLIKKAKHCLHQDKGPLPYVKRSRTLYTLQHCQAIADTNESNRP
eukprot:IDg11409t1